MYSFDKMEKTNVGSTTLKGAYMRQDNIAALQDTLSICEQGCYVKDNEKKKLKLTREQMEEARVFQGFPACSCHWPLWVQLRKCGLLYSGQKEDRAVFL